MGGMAFGVRWVWDTGVLGYNRRLRHLCYSIALQNARRKGRLGLSDFQKHSIWAGHLAVCISCLLVILLSRWVSI